MSMVDPQSVFRLKKFVGVVLDPPSFDPGSWRGAGDLLIDSINREYWLSCRPRVVGRRGYSLEIWYSTNGDNYTLTNFISKEEVSDIANNNYCSSCHIPNIECSYLC